ncbi:helix-turn-helix domain-containing protein [Chryseobacterium angstadtii]|nr:helix-turn-helix domain-containing protein [Chryseobacterium angstadtii]
MGSLIKRRMEESGIQTGRICSFFKQTEAEIQQVYTSKSLDTDLLLKWCKLLEYDFFRIYSQHLILYSPPTKQIQTGTTLPQFRKNIYTKEIIDYILDLIQTGEKTKKQVMEEYKIPKTTLYKWLSKYDNS